MDFEFEHGWALVLQLAAVGGLGLLISSQRLSGSDAFSTLSLHPP